jgi:hypothetical protein
MKKLLNSKLKAITVGLLVSCMFTGLAAAADYKVKPRTPIGGCKRVDICVAKDSCGFFGGDIKKCDLICIPTRNKVGTCNERQFDPICGAFPNCSFIRR